VNNLGTYGRWAFAEFTDIYEIESDFKLKVESEFWKMINSVVSNEMTATRQIVPASTSARTQHGM
jgi:type III restriction enzyme